MYNDQLIYKVVIWAFFGISLWKERVALNLVTFDVSDLMIKLLLLSLTFLNNFL